MDQRWRRTASGNARERIQYGFDRNGNRTFRDNLVASSGQDEYYSYDNLNQLLVLKRGDLNGGRTDISGTPVWQEDFTLDPTGNWRGTTSGYVTRNNGVVDLDQNRGNNMVNEITAITTTSGTAWTVPAYDAGGNMTTLARPGALGSGYSAKYDAWHRLVELKAGSTVVGAYRYDGTHRRVSKLVGSDTTHFYYSKQWQILEERLNASSSAARQFVWGMRYIDDLILRDQGGTRHYVLHDFFNVTAIVNTSGTVQERYGYNAYGECRVMTGSFGSRSSSSYNWETRYGAYRWDAESGLYQVRYRYLHPLLGVWLSRDPIGEEDGLNLYAYVHNKAINTVDVFGLYLGDWEDCKITYPPRPPMPPPAHCEPQYQRCLSDMEYGANLLARRGSALASDVRNFANRTESECNAGYNALVDYIGTCSIEQRENLRRGIEVMCGSGAGLIRFGGWLTEALFLWVFIPIFRSAGRSACRTAYDTCRNNGVIPPGAGLLL